MTQAKEIKKAAVIGAGVMGAPIAAILANAGIKVDLLDIVPKDAEDRNVIAKAAIERMKKASVEPQKDPLNGSFLVPSNAKNVSAGNIEDDWDRLQDADWIIEVVKEDLGLKKKIYKNIEDVRKDGAIVSSNTSTIPLEDLSAEMGEDMKKHFVISHFFNPPRFMRLLEIVSSKNTDAAALHAIKEFGDRKLGKDVVVCKDTPGFKGNRIGVFMLLKAIVEAYKHDMRPEEADAILGRPVGFEKSGVFGTLDVVGLDIMPHIMSSMKDSLPENDPFHAVYEEAEDLGLLELLNKMIGQGYTGRKGKGGFYRPKKDENGKTVKTKDDKTVLQTIDLKTGEYKDVQRPKFKSVENGKKGLKAALRTNDKAGRYAWDVLSESLLYAVGRVPEISDDISSVDLAMRSGFKWKRGPFEMIDAYGIYDFADDCARDMDQLPSWFSKAALAAESLYREENGRVQERCPVNGVYKNVPRPEGVVLLSDIKADNAPLIRNNSASVWDIGDGVVCLEFHSKMNSIDPSILLTINQTIDLINNGKGKYKALVLHNEAEHFSVGANLGFAQIMFKAGLYNVIEDMIYYGQSAYNALRYAPFPVIGAPKGMALGGGCEILLHCDAIQADAETYTGLVEVGVGVIPGWNGCARILERVRADKDTMGGPMPTARRAFEAVMLPQFSVSTSAPDAMKKLWLRPEDGVTMNSDRLLADAKERALSMVPNYTPPEPSTFSLPGQPGKAAIAAAIEEMAAQNFKGSKNNITKHDARVAHALADVLTGGDAANHTDILSEDDIAYLERRNFMDLVRSKETQHRIAYMVAKGQPYRERDMASVDEMRKIRSIKRKFNVANRPLKRAPLRGWDAFKLKAMAGMTWGMYKALGLK